MGAAQVAWNGRGRGLCHGRGGMSAPHRRLPRPTPDRTLPPDASPAEPPPLPTLSPAAAAEASPPAAACTAPPACRAGQGQSRAGSSARPGAIPARAGAGVRRRRCGRAGPSRPLRLPVRGRIARPSCGAAPPARGEARARPLPARAAGPAAERVRPLSRLASSALLSAVRRTRPTPSSRFLGNKPAHLHPGDARTVHAFSSIPTRACAHLPNAAALPGFSASAAVDVPPPRQSGS